MLMIEPGSTSRVATPSLPVRTITGDWPFGS
jgi:hypothetical protein